MTSWVCLLAMFANCTSYTTQGYQYRFDQQLAGGEDPEPAPVEARQLLAGARTVAFFPPDRCVNTTDKAESEKEFRASCGVLLSLLERAAERAGYEVVSWVNLRGTQRPIDYAREAKVDVLFEINEVATDTIRDVDAKRTLTFFDRTTAGDQPLTVTAPVAERCRGWSAQRDPQISIGDVGTIDIKTVSVADGRARWHYRKTLSRPTGLAPAKARFIARNQPNRATQALLTIGGVNLIVGVVFAGVDEAASRTEDPVTGELQGKTFGDYPYYLIAAGAVALTAGLVLGAVTGPRKPEPDRVLCLESTIPSNGSLEGAVTPTQAPASSQHTFDESRRGSDPHAEERKRLTSDMIQDFVQLLAEVKSSAPRAETSAPQPVPAAPPPAQP